MKPGDILANKKIKLNINSSTSSALTHLYTDYKKFSPSDNIGHFKISDTNAFSVVPSPESSPMVSNCLDKSSGGYCKQDGYYASDIVISLKKSNITGSGLLNLKFMALLKVDDNNYITECKSVNDISSAKENCEVMESDVSDYNWNEETLTCEVVAKNGSAEADGALSLNDPGDIDKKYIY